MSAKEKWNLEKELVKICIFEDDDEESIGKIKYLIKKNVGMQRTRKMLLFRKKKEKKNNKVN